VPDEQALALELDRALAGEEAADEARELAALLVAAAEPARVPVSDAEVERSLARVRLPAGRRRNHRRFAIPALAVAAAVAAALVLVLRVPGTDVQARAARAVDAIFFVVETVRPAQPGLFPPTDISGYVDGRTGRAHVHTGIAGETVVAADGRVERWSAAGNVLTYAPSCTALPGGCSEALDPLDLYVRTVEAPGVETRRTAAGYELRIRSGRVEQTILVDRSTYLPRHIEWRQAGRLVSRTTFVALERQRKPLTPDAWTMSPHPGARIVELAARGRRVRVLSVQPVRPPAGLRWLGPIHDGYHARVDEVRLTGGRAIRIVYGPLVVWDYDRVAPPAALHGRSGPAKVFQVGQALVHVYFGPGESQVAVASFAHGTVAVVSRSGDKIDAIRAVEHLLTVKRPGSP
jgi:hypothetical protein